MRSGMAILRYILVFASLVGAILSFNQLGRGYEDATLIFLYVVAVFVLNIVYLVLVPPKSKAVSRIGRLVNLWFEAKERELQERAKRPPQSNRGTGNE